MKLLIVLSSVAKDFIANINKVSFSFSKSETEKELIIMVNTVFSLPRGA